MSLYRITRTQPGTMPIVGAVTLCYGTHAEPHRQQTMEIYLGIAPRNEHGITHAYKPGELVTRVEDERGITHAKPVTQGLGDRAWSETHTALANQELRALQSRIQFYDERKTLDEEGKDARDFYRRLHAVIVRMSGMERT